MGKNKKEKPELTLENLNRAIRTYQREEVLYLIQHGILKDILQRNQLLIGSSFFIFRNIF